MLCPIPAAVVLGKASWVAHPCSRTIRITALFAHDISWFLAHNAHRPTASSALSAGHSTRLRVTGILMRALVARVTKMTFAVRTLQRSHTPRALFTLDGSRITRKPSFNKHRDLMLPLPAHAVKHARARSAEHGIALAT